MENIEQELEEKSIEKDTNDNIDIIVKEEVEEVVEAPKVKTKKVRSAKQIAAFEKARATRAAKIADKKKIKEDEKINKKTKIKEFKEQLLEQPPPPPLGDTWIPPHPKGPGNYTQKEDSARITNNYYYYGAPPREAPGQIDRYSASDVPIEKVASPKRKKIILPTTPPTERLIESESEDEGEYGYAAPPQGPSYQFNYA
tara:strand:- start:1469 stop:2065 length:597 start_codon:yes stop_codon:yes gene_type:complete